MPSITNVITRDWRQLNQEGKKSARKLPWT